MVTFFSANLPKKINFYPEMTSDHHIQENGKAFSPTPLYLHILFKGLDTVLTDKLIQLGFKHYFPVQRQIIPYLLEPHPYRLVFYITYL